MEGDISFELLITPAGALVAGGLVTGVVEIIKKALPVVDEKISGAQIAFLVSAVLYIITAIVLVPLEPNEALQVFAAWIGVALVAMGIKGGADYISRDSG